MPTYEIEIRTTQQTLDLGPPGSPLIAKNLEVYNGKIGLKIPDDFPVEIPGGVINVDDSLVVRFVNDLPAPIASSIHWHGIELQNGQDGTPVTQKSVSGGDLQQLGGVGPMVGGTFLYKMKFTRPGIFWFHPHHFHSTNRVFRGSYGMIVVNDPNDAALVASNTIPALAQTQRIVLSDITVCGAPGNNPPYNPSLPWAGGGPLPVQSGFSPTQICELPVNEEGENTDDFGNPFPPLAAGNVPNIQRPSGRVNEGITVLTNGRNVGPRGGTPTLPGQLVPADVFMINVQPNQGLRLQIVNCATSRYFRLKLTDNTGATHDLIRIGGEGGLLDHAVLEGGYCHRL